MTCAVLMAVSASGCTAEDAAVQAAAEIQTIPPTTESYTEETTAPMETVKHTSVTTADVSPAERLIGELTLEQKVGQLLLARHPQSDSKAVMEQYQLGGYTLYSEDIKNKTPSDLTTDIAAIQSAAKIPAFIAVDEEGGSIVRISKYKAFRSEAFPSQLELAKGGSEAIERDTVEKALLLRALGINLNLAPVADVTESSFDYIFSRTFGSDAETTGRYVSQIVTIMNKNKVGCCVKHFPGYGSNSDTHKKAVLDERSEDSFEKNDFIPFEYAIEAGTPAIMVNHNIVTAYDNELPASLSPAVHRLLREQLGFDGVIITDDLGMEAIQLYSGDESPYVLAVFAGNDLLCTSEIEVAYNDILGAVRLGRLEESRIDESVMRILNMKASIELLDYSQLSHISG